jgi:Tat protein secretion system quality control protein TatD with DNase activity
MLLETDCPYLSPVVRQRNEPVAVAQTLTYAAELWQVPEKDACQQFEANYRQLFGCDA